MKVDPATEEICRRRRSVGTGDAGVPPGLRSAAKRMKLRRQDVPRREVGHVMFIPPLTRGLNPWIEHHRRRENRLSDRQANICITRRQFARTTLASGALAAVSGFSSAWGYTGNDVPRTIGLAFGTYGMKTLTTEAALRTIARIGYDGVEPALMPGWPTDPAQLSAADRKTLRRLIGDLGLAVPAMLESLPLQGTPKSRAANLERLKRAVALGNELVPSSPPMIDTILGGKTADWERIKGRMVAELKDWAKVAEDGRTTVCFKPHAGDAVQSPDRALWLVREVGSPRIRIVYDYSHFYVEGLSAGIQPEATDCLRRRLWSSRTPRARPRSTSICCRATATPTIWPISAS